MRLIPINERNNATLLVILSHIMSKKFKLLPIFLIILSADFKYIHTHKQPSHKTIFTFFTLKRWKFLVDCVTHFVSLFIVRRSFYIFHSFKCVFFFFLFLCYPNHCYLMGFCGKILFGQVVAHSIRSTPTNFTTWIWKLWHLS